MFCELLICQPRLPTVVIKNNATLQSLCRACAESVQSIRGDQMNTISNLLTATRSRSTQVGQLITQQVRTGWLIAFAEGDLKLDQ
jgi:hypothetical protein